jgi:hypothetical protein
MLDYRQRQRENANVAKSAGLFVAALDGVKTPEQILLEREQAERLDRLIDQLKPPRLGLAVRYYYGIRCEPMTLERVADKFGVTKERVRQILHKAIRTLRHWILKADDPKVFREEREREREKAESRANTLRLEALRDTEYEKNAHQEWEQTEEQRALRAKQLREMLAEQEAKQRARDKRLAEATFDYAYYEAHRLNALWERELERREDAGRLQVKRDEWRQQEERRFKKTATKEQKRLMKLEAKWKRRALKAGKKARKLKSERDWLLVGSK